MSKLIYGVGINDADFTVKISRNGKQHSRPSYDCWRSMLGRCYSESYQSRYPTYIGCSVDSRWHSYLNFHNWYEKQYKEPGWQLDKDILEDGNKEYSPEKCVFVPNNINSFYCNCATKDQLHGAHFHKGTGKFMARCKNTLTGIREHFGYFEKKEDAHYAWKRRKIQIAYELLETFKDERVKQAIMDKLI